jgi:hypothetical protein
MAEDETPKKSYKIKNMPGLPDGDIYDYPAEGWLKVNRPDAYDDLQAIKKEHAKMLRDEAKAEAESATPAPAEETAKKQAK